MSSEDDPERLWCICKQPHNNRFMICCDNCLDWYHGKCVGITKRMGKERSSHFSVKLFHQFFNLLVFEHETFKSNVIFKMMENVLQDMEAVGNEWRCPKCVEETNKAKEDAQQAELNKKLKEREEIAAKKQKAAAATPSPAKKSFKRSNSSKSLDGQKDEKVREL